MLSSFGAILIYSAISYFQLRQLAKDKLKREMLIFSMLMLMVSGVTIAKFNNLPIPNPVKLISIIFDPVLKVIPGL